MHPFWCSATKKALTAEWEYATTQVATPCNSLLFLLQMQFIPNGKILKKPGHPIFSILYEL